jgi:2,4-dienoyl-CoA reductase (NADPH2)
MSVDGSTGGAGLTALRRPGTIGRLTLRNRFIQSPMHTRFATHFGEASDQFIGYHRRRAAGGVAMIIIENTAVDWEVGRAAGNPIRIDDDVFVSGLSDLTEAVHGEGALIAAQLHHAGRQNGTGNTVGAALPVAPSAIPSAAIGETPRALRADELPGIVQKFAAGARRVKAAGFDMVELHGSHGYLLTQFLSPQSNVREDEYGGSFENRARFPLEVVRAVREAVGPDFPVSYRVSVEERIPGGMELDEGVAFCRLIEPYVDVFNVTAATYESMNWIFTMQGVQPGSLLPLATSVRRAVSKPVIGVSRLGWALEEADAAVERGELDFVALARTQLTDPEQVVKTLAGDRRRVRKCIACNECVGGFLFQGWRVHCVINPELGQDHRLPQLYAPVASPRRVLVVGGGPAGCEAARAAALRGHDVSLVEVAGRLGGQLLASSAPRYKRREMEGLIEYYEAELDHLGVAITTGTRMTPDELDVDVDVLVVATGPRREQPPDDAVDLVEALQSRTVPDGPVVVVGSGENALNAAAFSREEGRHTWLVTGGAPLGADMNPLLATHTVDLIRRLGVTVVDDLDTAPPDAVRWWETARSPDDRPWHIASETVRVLDARTGGRRLFEATQRGFLVGTRA